MHVLDLNGDCLAAIFDFLEDDHTALHSCFLACRTWARFAVVLLWRDPRKILSPRGTSSRKLVKLFVRCLNREHERTVLARLKLNASRKPIPVFDYLALARVLPFGTLNTALQDWVHDRESGARHRFKAWINARNEDMQNNTQIAVRTLWRLMVGHYGSIRHVLFDWQSPKHHICDTAELLCENLEPLKSATKVSIVIDYSSGWPPPELSSVMSQVKRMRITLTSQSDVVPTITHVQEQNEKLLRFVARTSNNLTHLHMDFGTGTKLVPGIFGIICEQGANLKSLELRRFRMDVRDPADGLRRMLAMCTKLQSLIISHSIVHACTWSSPTPLPQDIAPLACVTFHGTRIAPCVVLSLLLMHGSTLDTLDVRVHKDMPVNDFRDAISLHCPRLRVLGVRTDNVERTFQLLSACRKLATLKISTWSRPILTVIGPGDLLHPPHAAFAQLSNISICGSYPISVQVLEELLRSIMPLTLDSFKGTLCWPVGTPPKEFGEHEHRFIKVKIARSEQIIWVTHRWNDNDGRFEKKLKKEIRGKLECIMELLGIQYVEWD